MPRMFLIIIIITVINVTNAMVSPEGGLCQEPRGVVTVLHIGHGDGGVGHPIEHHRVHRHRHRVLGQDLARLGFTLQVII